MYLCTAARQIIQWFNYRLEQLPLSRCCPKVLWVRHHCYRVTKDNKREQPRTRREGKLLHFSTVIFVLLAHYFHQGLSGLTPDVFAQVGGGSVISSMCLPLSRAKHFKAHLKCT
jgi:hypothetical protein